MTMTKPAKLFKNGSSQAVRLPAEFRLPGDEVYVTRDEETGMQKLRIFTPISGINLARQAS